MYKRQEWYGDVSEIWGRLEQIGWENAREHNIEAVIRQQIQIDILSREQRRLVRVVVILQVLHGSIWRLFVPSSSTGSRMMKYVKQEHQRLKVLTTCPESVAAIYWLGLKPAACVLPFWPSTCLKMSDSLVGC